MGWLVWKEETSNSPVCLGVRQDGGGIFVVRFGPKFLPGTGLDRLSCFASWFRVGGHVFG